jgi:hypothetical protein
MHLGGVGSGGLLVEAVQARPDHVAFGVGPGEGEQAPQLFFDHVCGHGQVVER